MDPVGCSASILTLAGTALAVGKIGADLVQAFQDAPQELRATVLKIRTIQVQLEQLTQIGLDLRKTDEQLLSSRFSQTIQSALESSLYTLTLLQKALPSIDAQDSSRSRLRWLFLERTKVNKYSQRLQYVQQDLGLALQILDMHATHFKPMIELLLTVSGKLHCTSKNQSAAYVECKANFSRRLSLFNKRSRKYASKCHVRSRESTPQNRFLRIQHALVFFLSNQPNFQTILY